MTAKIDIQSIDEKIQQVIFAIDALSKRIKAIRPPDLSQKGWYEQRKTQREHAVRSHLHKACSMQLDALQPKINFVIKLTRDLETRQLRLLSLYKKLKNEARV